MVSKNRTRKSKGSNIDVRSDKAIKMFEKTIVKGPLTVVFVKLEGCGPCDQLNKEVWSPLTKLKNRSVNLARVDSQTFKNTSLSGTPLKYYPSLLLVGKDGKPATYKDKDGSITHSMPRNNTLTEDRKTLTEFVQNPTLKTPDQLESLKLSTTSPIRSETTYTPTVSNTLRSSSSLNKSNNTRKNTLNSVGSRNNSPTRNNSPSRNNSPTRNTFNKSSIQNNTVANTLNKSSIDNSLIKPSMNINTNSKPKSPFNESTSNKKAMSSTKQILSSNPPDIGADLLSTKPLKKSAISVKSGGMLDAIRSKTASLKAMLRLSEPRLTRKKHH